MVGSLRIYWKREMGYVLYVLCDYGVSEFMKCCYIGVFYIINVVVFSIVFRFIFINIVLMNVFYNWIELFIECVCVMLIEYCVLVYF